jgi:hypothetical protein
MISQLRTYTINKGMMDSWLETFDTKIRPIHEKIGIPIEATWVNADRTDFVWIRSFESAEAIPAKEAEYYGSPERKELGDLPQTHIAKIEVRVIEPVLAKAAA